jgi:hypothetical protein
MTNIWDVCTLSSATESNLNRIKSRTTHGLSSLPQEGGKPSSLPGFGSENRFVAQEEANGFLRTPSSDKGSIDMLQSSLRTAEGTCRGVMEELDLILSKLEDVGREYDDVTSRTNSLVVNCEAVLHEQRQLEAMVEKLHGVLGPFNEMEQVATLLGVPFDPSNTNADNKLAEQKGLESRIISSGSGSVQDPRSQEFRQALHRLAKASAQVDQHHEFQDGDKYRMWLGQLQNRALGLISRGIRVLLDGASRQASDAMVSSMKQRSLRSRSSISVKGQGSGDMGSNDQPLESAPLYKRFRGLSFRVRELVALLEAPSQPAGDQEGPPEGLLTLGGLPVAAATFRDVTRGYVEVRQKLLAGFLKDLLGQALESSGLNAARGRGKGSPRGSGSSGGVSKTDSAGSTSATGGGTSNGSLCALLRQAYSNLHRIAQLELQLFESLFFPGNDGGEGEGEGEGDTKAAMRTDMDSRDVLVLVEGASSLVGDALRPTIIHQDSVDELCKAISVLSEDVRSHTINARLPVHLRKELLKGLDRTICDAQERLSFCAEVALRNHIIKFSPLPSNVAYPDLLEAAGEAYAMESTVKSTLTGDETDVSRTWYPSLKHTLSLLSKLYGVVETSVFEDFARRAVGECVQSLQRGSEAVKKKSSSDLIASLFLVRHLLVLREQLMPFDIRLQGTEKRLDFKPTGEAFSAHLSLGGISGALKLTSANGLLRFAREGLPQVQESLLDAKGELDRVLKLACGILRDAALKMLVGSELDSLLAKVQAFTGDIPVQRATANAQGEPGTSSSLLAAKDQAPPLAAELATKLRTQAFLRPERLLAVLNDAQQALQHTLPELRRLLTLHIDSSVARAILMKPVTQELELQKMKMLSVVAACVDAGQSRRDIEQLLSAIHDGINSELVAAE